MTWGEVYSKADTVGALLERVGKVFGMLEEMSCVAAIVASMPVESRSISLPE